MTDSPGSNEPDRLPGLLRRIVQTKEEEIAQLPEAQDLSQAPPVRSFYQALERPPGVPIRVIAECKKASPSMGLMRPDYHPGEIARTYAELGAAASSILTDRRFFQGDPGHLQEARDAGIPLLRKDFILSEKQLREARALGADAALLIVRLLDKQALADLLAAVAGLGMDALVEIHDEAELDAALESEARIIGINHRNLDTLKMDLSLTEKLAPRIRREKPEARIVAESGVESPEGRARVDAYADAVLIGTAFMKSSDIRATWRAIFS